MENRHRDCIRKNVDSLVSRTLYEPLIKACEDRLIISQVMRRRIENLPNATDEQKHKELFIKLTKRGPTAYDELVKILMDLNFESAANLLRPPQQNNGNYISIREHKTNPSIIPIKQQIPPETVTTALPEGCYPTKDTVDNIKQLIPFSGNIDPPETFKVIKSTAIKSLDPNFPAYPMKSKNRGVFFMVNIIDFPFKQEKKRSGAEMDSKNLLHLFKEFGFICFSYKNLTEKEFFNLLTELRSSHYLAETECFVLVLMSHGEMREDLHDRVEFYGGSFVKVKRIEDFFSNNDCRALVGKPKVLIFPFCRGDVPDKGIPDTKTDSSSSSSFQQVESFSDILVCYGSVRGFQTLRDADKGSWYIQEFCKVLAMKACDMHLEDMLKLIAANIKHLESAEGYRQTPAFYNHGFDKHLYFNPGIYE